MAELPTGTLTLLFSDIEGSTVLLHKLGERWGEALSAHREILRAAFAEHEGTEMGTEGDSFFVVFRTAHGAVRAALAGQVGLRAHSWPGGADVRVRMGIHTGEPERHEDGYVGEDVHRAARIGSTANGGQIVLSGATRRLVSDLSDTADIEIRDLGHHRLKDLAGEEHLYDVVAPGTDTEFPPLRSLGKTSALPTAATPLVGRDADLRSVSAVFVDEHARLVTLTGPGGSGKTRLATAIAGHVEPNYLDGIYFVALQTVDRGELMWSAISDVLGTGTATDASPAGRVTSQLAEHRALLVLDNLEQIEDADVVVSDLLSAAPHVQVLATSRRPLLLVGEYDYPVPPLALPDSADPDAVLASAAVEMFVSHAQMVRPAFALTDANRADVAELCRRLDGLPLALELAAAHSRLLSPHALLSRIDGRLGAGRLGAGLTAADRPERQRTLGATIAWSYDLLDDTERAVFRRLGVFRDSCDLDAIAAVAGDEGVDVLDIASRLVGKNLVRVEEASDAEPRIALLETIRVFALEQLQDSGEAELVRLRHLRWCVDVAERMGTLLRGPRQLMALDSLSAVENDIRSALEWSLRPVGADGRDRVEAGIKLLTLVTNYWYRFGSVAAAEARGWQERGVGVAEDVDSEPNVTLLHGLGVAVLQQGDTDEAVTLFQRALEMAQRLGHDEFQARAYNDLSIARRNAGEYAEALRLLRRSLDIARKTGSVNHEAAALCNLVVVYGDLGRYADAAQTAQEAMAADIRRGDAWGVAIDRLNYTGAILMSEGAQAAHARYVEWAADISSFQDKDLTVELMELGAGIAAGLDEPTLAARLLAGADTQRSVLEIPRSEAQGALVAKWTDPARTSIPASAWDEAYASGTGLAPEAAIELVESIGADQRH